MNIPRRDFQFLAAMTRLQAVQPAADFKGHRYFCDPEDGGCSEEWFAGNMPGRMRCFKCDAIVESK
jgi:hypothetical protein